MRSILVFFTLSFAPGAGFAADPLQRELDACAAYCKGHNQRLLGLKAAQFDGAYGRACVCSMAKPPAPAADRKMAAPSRAAGIAARGGTLFATERSRLPARLRQAPVGVRGCRWGGGGVEGR